MSISRADLDIAYRRVLKAWRECKDSNDWEDLKLLEDYGAHYMRVTRRVRNKGSATSGSLDPSGEEQQVEDDDQALIRHHLGENETEIIYDIIHSPSYQVPVLYLTLRVSSADLLRGEGLPSADEVYPLLVPAGNRAQVEDVGVLGALSMTEHPCSSLPAYFIHPCRTPEAMESIAGGESTGPTGYLLQWLGLVGGSVGLNVPVEVAEILLKASPSAREEISL